MRDRKAGSAKSAIKSTPFVVKTEAVERIGTVRLGWSAKANHLSGDGKNPDLILMTTGMIDLLLGIGRTSRSPESNGEKNTNKKRPVQVSRPFSCSKDNITFRLIRSVTKERDTRIRRAKTIMSPP